MGSCWLPLAALLALGARASLQYQGEEGAAGPGQSRAGSGAGPGAAGAPRCPRQPEGPGAVLFTRSRPAELCVSLCICSSPGTTVSAGEAAFCMRSAGFLLERVRVTLPAVPGPGAAGRGLCQPGPFSPRCPLGTPEPPLGAPREEGHPLQAAEREERLLCVVPKV